MQKGSLRLQKLIKDILIYSRLTSNNDFFSQANLNEIINEILIDLELKIKESNAKISVAKLPELFVNPGQIRQVFQNIISNSLKFFRTGIPLEIAITADISNRAGARPANGQMFCNISITDNGIGFDESYAEQIFILFKRLNDKNEGTGIGLAICKKILEQHKGFIYAKSKIGEGSTFTISLPMDSKAEKNEVRNFQQYNFNKPEIVVTS
jgi:signal transduction histidine kinase